MAASHDASPADVTGLTLASLAHRCSQECSRFFRRLANDPRFCYELFRRAIQDQNQLAWRHVYNQFSPLVSGWVLRHLSFRECGEEAGYFVNRAFERFWNAVTPEKFSQHSSLNSLLKYLQLCVHSAIVDFLRKREADMIQLEELNQMSGNPDDDIIESEVIQLIHKKQLWEAVAKRLKSEKEQTVIHATFVLGLKAREVQALHKDQFPNVQEIYQIRKNVLARLRRDLAFMDQFALEGS